MNSTERKRPSWDEYGMLLAYAAAQRSPDPYVAVGAAAFRIDRSTAGTGYNGATPGREINWQDRDARRPHVVHAERNCLRNLKIGEPHYLFVTLSPCTECLAAAAHYDVKEIIYDKVYDRDPSALRLATNYGITLKQISLPDEYISLINNLV